MAFFPWFFWSLFNVSLHLPLKLINLGNLQYFFDVGEAATPPWTLQGFQRSHLLGLYEKNSTAKIWQIFWQNFLRKLVFLNFIFFTFLPIIMLPGKISEHAVPHQQFAEKILYWYLKKQICSNSEKQSYFFWDIL